MVAHQTTERKKPWAVGLRGLTAIFRVKSVVAALALFAAMNSHAAPTEVMLVYGDNTVGTPKYRIWTNSAWTAESTNMSVGSAAINWVVVKACPTRDEYIAATEDASSVVKAQVYRNGSWTNLQTIATAPNAAYRGVDIAYETLSGDAIVVGC